MRDRALTGPWAGFSFEGGRLVTPEGHRLLPQDLAWLGLTASIAQEWRAMMADDRARVPPRRPAGVVYLRDELRARRKAKERRQRDVAAAEGDRQRIITATGAEALPARVRRYP